MAWSYRTYDRDRLIYSYPTAMAIEHTMELLDRMAVRHNWSVRPSDNLSEDFVDSTTGFQWLRYNPEPEQFEPRVEYPATLLDEGGYIPNTSGNFNLLNYSTHVIDFWQRMRDVVAFTNRRFLVEDPTNTVWHDGGPWFQTGVYSMFDTGKIYKADFEDYLPPNTYNEYVYSVGRYVVAFLTKNVSVNHSKNGISGNIPVFSSGDVEALKASGELLVNSTPWTFNAVSFVEASSIFNLASNSGRAYKTAYITRIETTNGFTFATSATLTLDLEQQMVIVGEPVSLRGTDNTQSSGDSYSYRNIWGITNSGTIDFWRSYEAVEITPLASGHIYWNGFNDTRRNVYNWFTVDSRSKEDIIKNDVVNQLLTDNYNILLNGDVARSGEGIDTADLTLAFNSVGNGDVLYFADGIFPLEFDLSIVEIPDRPELVEVSPLVRRGESYRWYGMDYLYEAGKDSVLPSGNASIGYIYGQAAIGAGHGWWTTSK